jgi:RNA 2',3'-cyclic 3'-phosphodiesterase
VARAFVAVRPPDGALDAAEALVDSELSSIAGARWTTREQRHLTLQFLGNHADIDAVGAALGALALRSGTVALGGVGVFPSARRARVLWVGVATGSSFLAQLSAAVGALLAPLGHEPEERQYHPHLTLARFKASLDLRDVIAAHADRAVGAPFPVDEVVLYESSVRNTGARYTARAVVTLSG